MNTDREIAKDAAIKVLDWDIQKIEILNQLPEWYYFSILLLLGANTGKIKQYKDSLPVDVEQRISENLLWSWIQWKRMENEILNK